jgi:flavin-dependent dehydrogenase
MSAGLENGGSRFDVVVVGAGPCGSIAARRLALEGWSVLLVDRAVFPRDKVCGCCLNQAALDVLEAEGLLERVIPPAAPRIHSVRVWQGRTSVTMRTRPGIAVSRWMFDERLVEAAAEAGCTVMTGISARLGTRTDDGWSVELGSETINARRVVCADGIGGSFLPRGGVWEPSVRPSSRMGLGARVPGDWFDIPSSTIDMHIGQGGYVGMVRLEDGSIDIAAAVAPELVRACTGTGGAIGTLLRGGGLSLPPDFGSARFRGTPLLTRRRRVLEAEGVFVAGDAAGYVEPFTGEGMSWGLVTGVLAARAAESSMDGSSEPGWYTRLASRTVGPRRVKCGLVAAALRSPAAVGVALSAARAVGSLGGQVGWIIGKPFSIPRVVARP